MPETQPFKLQCPECGATANGNPALVGMKIKCPKCKKTTIFKQIHLAARMVAPKKETPDDAMSAAVDDSAKTIPCPMCAEPINPAAKKCKHCGEFLTGSKQATEETAPKKKASCITTIGGGFLVFVGLFALYIYFSENSRSVRTTSDLTLPSIGTQSITMAKYLQLKNGMSYNEVTRILGKPGEEMSRNKMDGVAGVMDSVETIMYQWINGNGSNMNAMFQNDKLVQKSQFGLP